MDTAESSSSSEHPTPGGGRVGAKTWTILASTLGLLLVVILAGRQHPAVGSARDLEPQKRGEYLVTVAGCNDCHTPLTMAAEGPQPDLSRMLSGHPEGLTMPAPPPLGEGPWLWAGAATNTAFVGPWGVSYATNLTPDENTGIGIWSEEMFIKTLRTGRHWGVARPILPPMPWQNYAAMSDEDLLAVYAYLRSIPAVVNRVPEAVPQQGK